MATNGGNLLQRTRCQYFYDTAMPCNKREPGTRLRRARRAQPDARHPRLERASASPPIPATWRTRSTRSTPSCGSEARTGASARSRSSEFHRLPGDTPQRDTNLEHGELIVAIELPKSNFAKNSYYLKVRDRASYAFALVAVAAALELDGGTIRQARVVLGGVAHKPWRSREAEAALAGKPASEESFRRGRRGGARRTRSRSRTTPTRSSWRSGPSFAR